MPLLHSKWLRPSLVLLAVLFVAVASAAVFLWGAYYRHWENSFVTRVADALPVPAAKFASRTILYRDYLRGALSVETYLLSDEAKKLNVSRAATDDDRKNVLERLLREMALEELAQARKISVSDELMRQALAQFNVDATTTQEFQRLLALNFGWTVEDFKAHIVRPALLTNLMSASYAVDHGNDPQALEKYLDERVRRADVVRYVKF